MGLFSYKRKFQHAERYNGNRCQTMRYKGNEDYRRQFTSSSPTFIVQLVLFAENYQHFFRESSLKRAHHPESFLQVQQVKDAYQIIRPSLDFRAFLPG